MLFDGLLLTEINRGTAKSAEVGQTACICKLIMLYTLQKINPWLQTAGQRLTPYQTAKSCIC